MFGLKSIKQKLEGKNNQINLIASEVSSFKYFIKRLNLEDKIINCNTPGISTEKYTDVDIIVSLTTYGRRINDVCITIESIMQQTKKANRIILWIDENLNVNELPSSLKLQMKRGLEVKYTRDIRSFTKLIPALKAFPDAAIITIDDDLIYDFDLLDRLISAFIMDRASIHACRTHTMTFNEEGTIMPYSMWEFCKSATDKPTRNFLTGVGGVLYPPSSLPTEVFHEETFSSICPTADDVWFTAMAIINQTPIKKVPTRNPQGEDYILNLDVQDMGLYNMNTGEGGRNDIQIKKVFDKYNVYKFID